MKEKVAGTEVEKGQPRPDCGGSFSGGCEDLLAIVVGWHAWGGLMKGKVSGVTVSVEVEGMDQKTWTLALGPGIWWGFLSSFRGQGFLKKKAGYYLQYNLEQSSILISCWNLLWKYYREKSGFLLLYLIYSTTSQMHFCEKFFPNALLCKWGMGSAFVAGVLWP